MPNWVFKLLSYISTFTYGGYVYAAVHGNPPETYRWVLTGFFGIMFFIFSISKKETISL